MSLSRRKLPSSPLQLDTFWLEELSVKANAEWDEAERYPSSDLPLSGRTEIVGVDEGKFLVRLNVSTKGARKPVPYSLDVTAGGIFAVPASLAEEDRDRFIHLNGSAVLYGVIRGAVASLTGMGPWAALTLPSVNFVHFFEHAHTEAEAEAE